MRRRRLVAITLVVALALIAAIALGARRVWRERPDTSLHASFVTAIAISADGTRVVTGDQSGVLKLWDVRDCHPIAERCVRTFRAVDASCVTALAFFPDGGRVLAGDSFGRVRIWDIDSGELVRELGNHKKLVSSVDVSPDGGRAASATDGDLACCDLARGSRVARPLPEVYKRSIRFSPDGTALAVGSGCNEVRFRDPITLDQHSEFVQCERAIRWHGIEEGPPCAFPTYAADGRCAIGTARAVELFDASGRCVGFADVDRPVFACFVDGGKRVAIAGNSGFMLLVWDPVSAQVAHGEIRYALKDTRDGHRTPVFASDGRIVVAAWSHDAAADSVRVLTIPPR